ncbi:type II toxin-antitoxin system MqsA family antitoxin [Paraburkholderia sediminicola]|uniref:type II toxin-antitoxin system MqsA family antitoxin n=1 Tax=Paraburkholderia sediminicola TaxID=458836 RepID=UPI0038B7B6E9
MKCPGCGAAELVRDTRDIPFAYKGHTTVISSVTADFCRACGESLTGPVEGDRVMKLMRAFKQEVDEAHARR